MQQFHKGDWVWVAKDLGNRMSHFPSDCEAIVIGSYADKFGGDTHDSYTLHLKGHGECSWYYGHQLTLIETNRLDMLEVWENEKKADTDQKSDIDWIFSNGEEVIEKLYAASIKTLADCLGIKNLWGNRGEGFTYFCNSIAILSVAIPYLKSNDKAGWLDFCKESSN